MVKMSLEWVSLDRMPLDRVNSVALLRVVTVLVLISHVALWPLPASAAGTQSYLSGADDLPLMTGLEEVPGSALVFDKPGGRIVEVEAVGVVSRSQVATFYGSALPQLGWVAIGQDETHLRYQRDDEILAIRWGARNSNGASEDKDGGGSVMIVNFTISPKPIHEGASPSD